jgi:multisubunit Na+/H+ antiporter MnhB subunit
VEASDLTPGGPEERDKEDADPDKSTRSTLYKPETVEELTRALEQHAAFERERLRAAQGRAGALVAVIGGIVTLGTTQARETLNQAAILGEGGQVVSVTALIIGLLIIIGAAACALWAAASVPDWELKDEELDNLGTKETAEQPKVQVLANYNNLLIDRIKQQRKGWGDVRRRLGWALWLLVIGLVFLVVHIAVFGERTIDCDAVQVARSEGAQQAQMVQNGQQPEEQRQEQPEVDFGVRCGREGTSFRDGLAIGGEPQPTPSP